MSWKSKSHPGLRVKLQDTLGVREAVESATEERKQKHEEVRGSQGEVGGRQELEIKVLTGDMLEHKHEPENDRPCNPYEEGRI